LSKNIEILLIRHGETAGNAKKQYIGRTDVPLSPEGAEKAKLTAVHYDTKQVYVSPLLRARQTASIKFPNAEQRVIDGLREMDFGVFEGRSAEEMQFDSEYESWVQSRCLDRCPGGDTFDEFKSRVLAAFNDIINDFLSLREERAVIVAHGGTIMSIMFEHAPERRDFYAWPVPNCGGYLVTADGDTWPDEPRFLTFESI
jgi:alpha-ribazole phosphatase